jgi:CheY-like chemotaxis protein
MLALNDRVAVIDDNEDGRDTIVDDLDALNFKGIPIVGPFGDDLERLLYEVECFDPQFVICDLRLSPRQFATFSGLRVVEELIARQRPAMLLTTYQDPERLHLRAARSRVPVIRGRDGFRIQDVTTLHEIVRREIEHEPVPSRKRHRVLVNVEDVRPDADEIDVVVPSWRRDHALVLPRSLLGEAIRTAVKPGDTILGKVNIGATDEDELFFDELDEIIEVKDGLL